jgi:hypothetical protein
MTHHAAPPLAFGAALLGLGGLFLLWPKAAPYLGAALVLGSLFAAEQDARSVGLAGPLRELGYSQQRRS